MRDWVMVPSVRRALCCSLLVVGCTGAQRGTQNDVPAAPPAGQVLPAASPAAAERQARFERQSRAAEERGLAEPFRGITTSGEVVPGLFGIRSTGVSTEPMRTAAAAFIATLAPSQRARTLFADDDPEWRKWMNQHFYVRQGTSFGEMGAAQRDAALAMLRASLSAKGLRTTRDIMRLNHTLGELTGNFEEYGEGLYWITIMGTPSVDEPWGWQLDGHHLNVNYFVLGDQVVMTPTFMGSEPVRATSGRYAGTVVMQAEQDRGLAMIRSLDAVQRAKAVVRLSKTGNDNVSEAFRDNVVLEYAGIRGAELTPAQRTLLLALVGEFVGHLRDGHAAVRMDEVRRHLDDTWFAWIGGMDDESVFYYRVQSPVILIEFDHQRPVAMRDLERGVPTRQHVHTVVRTPNGNDYGKDLLREHHAKHSH